MSTRARVAEAPGEAAGYLVAANMFVTCSLGVDADAPEGVADPHRARTLTAER